jgi:hypothetical protein
MTFPLYGGHIVFIITITLYGGHIVFTIPITIYGSHIVFIITITLYGGLNHVQSIHSIDFRLFILLHQLASSKLS